MQLADHRLFTMLPWQFQTRGVAQMPRAESPRSPSLPCTPAGCPLLPHSAPQPLIMPWWGHQPPLCPLLPSHFLGSLGASRFLQQGYTQTHPHNHTQSHLLIRTHEWMHAQVPMYYARAHTLPLMHTDTFAPTKMEIHVQIHMHILHTVPWLKAPEDPH